MPAESADEAPICEGRKFALTLTIHFFEVCPQRGGNLRSDFQPACL